MAKKHWIYIKRGLSEDPKHRAQMGECVWLYMHIIDRADWETGVAYDWKDRQEAVEMGINFETLRDQRQKLEKMDYIRCNQKQRGQDIRIMEWKNPRDYSSEVKNPRIQGDLEASPSEFQGDPHGDPQVSSQPVTHSLDSKIKDPDSTGKNIFQIYQDNIGMLTPMNSEILKDIEDEYPVGWFEDATLEAVKNNKRNLAYIAAILKRWKVDGKDSGKKKVEKESEYETL